MSLSTILRRGIGLQLEVMIQLLRARVDQPVLRYRGIVI